MLTWLRERIFQWHEGLRQRPFWRLVEHFGTRIFQTGSESGDDELDLGIGTMFALLASPGAFASMFLFDKYSSLIRFIRGNAPFDPYDASLPDSYFFIVFSMVITGAVTLLKWDVIFPDRRDYMNLAPLPLRTRSIFLANLLAVVSLAVLFAIDVNAVSSVMFPVLVNLEHGTFMLFLYFAGVHMLSVLLAGLFIFFAMFALIGALMLALPRRLFRRVSLYLRVAGIMYLLTLLVTSFAVPTVLRHLHGTIPLRIYLLPPAWFLAFSRVLVGRATPELSALARFGFTALLMVIVTALVLYGASYRRHFTHIPESTDTAFKKRFSRRWILNPLSHRWLLRTPFQKACYPFILRTLMRSERHLLFLGAFAGLGLVIASQDLLFGFSHQAGLSSSVPSTSLLAIPLVLSYFLICGLRFVFEMPTELRANWVHKMIVDPEKHESAAVSCKVILTFIWPWLVLIALPVYAYYWGWMIALEHTVVVLLWSWCLTGLLLLRFRKIPFTCSYPPWHEYSVVLVVFYVLGLYFFTTVTAGIEVRLLPHPVRLAIFVAGVFIGWRMLMKHKAPTPFEQRLIFEEQPVSPVETLNLFRS